MENRMSNFKKSFKSFAEAKEKGLADNNGSIPNQDIPKADKGPHLLDLKKSLAGRDYKGQMSTNPVKGTKEDPLPYKGGEVKDQEQNKLLVHDEDDVKSGFAFKGNKVQTPENSAALGEKPDIRIEKVKSQKMKSESFIEQTKDLSPEGFINFFVEGSDEPLPTITDLYGNQFTPDPNQTMQYMAALMVKNPRLLSRFVREMKRHDGGMGQLLNENFSHPEFYTMLAEGMAAPEEGRKRCKRISRAMNEQYMDALNKYVMEQKINEEVQPKVDLAFEDGGPIGKGPQNPSQSAPARLVTPQGGSMGGGGGPQLNNGGGSPTMQSPTMGGAFGGGGPMGGAGGMGGSPGAGMPGAGPSAPAGMPGAPPPIPPAGGGGLDMGQGVPPGAPPMPKLKGETAHGNMIEEMGGYPHMFAHMSDYCVNCKKK